MSAPNLDPKLDFAEFYNVVDGKLESTEETRRSLNPSTLEKNPPVPVSTRKDVDRAVQAAKVAAESWAAVPYKERQKAVARFADGLETLKGIFAHMLTREQGKPVRRDSYF
jgi:acyl-CoA reductase-like NAD-dependent aldehyde dehydrogenase